MINRALPFLQKTYVSKWLDTKVFSLNHRCCAVFRSAKMRAMGCAGKHHTPFVQTRPKMGGSVGERAAVSAVHPGIVEPSGPGTKKIKLEILKYPDGTCNWKLN